MRRGGPVLSVDVVARLGMSLQSVCSRNVYLRRGFTKSTHVVTRGFCMKVYQPSLFSCVRSVLCGPRLGRYPDPKDPNHSLE